ncbi:MAG: M14 family zinc carboxypeptidase [Candidatus Krumholzibacteriia bacterium]
MNRRVRSCTFLLLASLAVTAASALAAGTSLVEIPYKGPGQIRALLERGLDVLAVTRDGNVHVAATPEDRPFLAGFGAKPRVLATPGASDLIAELDANLGAYRTYDETVAVIQALEVAHPNILAVSVIGQSIELRPIYAMKISDNAATDEAEPEVLLMGCHHARELMSVEMPLKFAEHLLANYGADPDVTQMVDEREIWVVPIVNPDGYVEVQNNHPPEWWTWWRKNRRDNGDGSFGVDLNRNYAYNWGLDEQGSSSNTFSPVYRGTAPFSEPESQAIRDLCNGRQFVIWLAYHSYSELLLFPWGYAYEYTTDHEIFEAMANAMTASNGYLAGNPAMGAIYLTNGGSDDWGYGEVTTKPAIYAYTPEVGKWADGGFGPPDTFIDPYFNLLLPMNMLALELAGNPQKVLGPVSPTLQTAHTTAGSEIVLGWSDNLPSDPNPAATYDLEHYLNPGFLSSDDAESASPLLSLAGGFVAVIDTLPFQGSRSYYSGQQNNLSSTLTTVAPYEVGTGTNVFTCWMRYEIETHWDYAYVEVSEDQGVIWRPIQGNLTTQSNPNGSNRGHGITGNSNGWTQASFALDDYMGQEILLRIHYVTDGAVLGEGLYVDMLGPVPSFDEHAVFATGVSGTSHTFLPGTTGTYKYLVRGTDAEGDTGRWSRGFVVEVGDPVSTRILPPAQSALGRNVPNPFNPRTLLPYTIGSRLGTDAARNVDLSIYDAAGRRVATLVHTPLAPGHYRASWDGTDELGRRVPSGPYFARLSVDRVPSRARKLLLLK